MAGLVKKFLNKNLENIFKNGKKCIISIQGCSTSGKTTLANIIYQELKENYKQCKPFVFNMDNFYKSDPIDKVKDYDYDNPAALDWENMVNSLKSFFDDGTTIKYSSYQHSKYIRKDVEIPNENYNLIIVEGIFAHNIFSKDTFNISALDPSDTFKTLEDSDQRVKNECFEFFNENARICPIFLDLSDKIIISNRIKIDGERIFKSPEDSKEYTEKYVIRSTNKWIRSLKLPNSICFKRMNAFITLNQIFWGIFKHFNFNENINKMFKNISSTEPSNLFNK